MKPGFRIERSRGNTKNFKPVGVVSQNATSFIDTGLKGNTTYYYRIASTINDGFSTYSNVAEVQIITGLEESEHSISVYPNPADDYLIISSRNFHNERFTIHKINGQAVYSGTLLDNNEAISFKQFPPGVYVLSVGHKKIKILKR